MLLRWHQAARASREIPADFTDVMKREVARGELSATGRLRGEAVERQKVRKGTSAFTSMRASVSFINATIRRGVSFDKALEDPEFLADVRRVMREKDLKN